jgi:4-hydroxy-tetrahydrodipicolinate reductase
MSSHPLKIVVVGSAGRMGRLLIRAVMDNQNTVLHAALERPASPAIGQDSGILAGLAANGVLVCDDLDAGLHGAEAILDFTAPSASVYFAERAATLGLIHILGTTGMNAAEEAAIAGSARGATIIRSGNFSLGVNMLAALVERAAAALDTQWDIEIVEMHHRAKVDAPSGTALLLGEAAARGRGIDLSTHSERGRDGHTGARAEGAVGFASLRGGSVVGDHTVILASGGERIELRHIAEDRGLFAAGAVKAALWARGRAPGLYSMRDVLGLAP